MTPKRSRSRHRLGTARAVGAAAAVIVTVALLLTGCAGARADSAQRLTVFGAASLHAVLDDLAEQFERAHNVEVALSLAGSSDLLAQLEAGARADVLVTADERTMTRAESADLLASDPVLVASNHLVLVTPPGNPGQVTGLADSRTSADLVVCAPQVPCGAASVELADQLGVELAPVSQEPSVTAVLAKVTTGQADAGLVYTSDALGAGAGVETVEIPGAEHVTNRYPAALLRTARDHDLAQAWLDLLTGPEGRTAFAAAGFGEP